MCLHFLIFTSPPSYKPTQIRKAFRSLDSEGVKRYKKKIIYYLLFSSALHLYMR